MPWKPFQLIFRPTRDPHHFFSETNGLFRLNPWVFLVFLLVLLCGKEARAEIYTIQAGIFKNLENAKLQYTSIYNALPKDRRSGLRIEKSGKTYAVRIGRFETRSQADALLPLIKPVSPEAFIRKGDFVSEKVLEVKTSPPASLGEQPAKIKPPESGITPQSESPSWKIVKPIPPEEEGPPPEPTPLDHSPTAKGIDQPKTMPPDLKEPGLKRKPKEQPPPAVRVKPDAKNDKAPGKGPEPSGQKTFASSRTDSPAGPASSKASRGDDIPTNRAWLMGSIREFSPLSSGQLGLNPGKEIFRLILQVEDSKEVAGYTNLLTEKEGDMLTVFSEDNKPFFKVGNRIKALIEYRGNRYSRFFWIVKAEILAQ